LKKYEVPITIGRSMLTKKNAAVLFPHDNPNVRLKTSSTKIQ